MDQEQEEVALNCFGMNMIQNQWVGKLNELDKVLVLPLPCGVKCKPLNS